MGHSTFLTPPPSIFPSRRPVRVSKHNLIPFRVPPSRAIMSSMQPPPNFRPEPSALEQTSLYPRIEPFHSGELAVSDLHTIYYEVSGNPEGLPVLFVHGGPGGGTVPAHRRFFNPLGTLTYPFFLCLIHPRLYMILACVCHVSH